MIIWEIVSQEQEKNMNRINIIVWLSAGVMIGWFASWITAMERLRELRLETIADEDSDGS
jgi:hypothetical protein